jgi:hypothetical protein
MSQILAPAVAGLLVLGVGVGYLIGFSGTSLAPARRSAGQQPSAAPAVAFLVMSTGTRYQRATLRAQVRDTLDAQVWVPAVEPVQPTDLPSPVPAMSTSSLSAGQAVATIAPSHTLIGCVMHLTGDVLPMLVDRATYQSQPVYVIAVPDKAWVVGVGCTASDPGLITTVGLTTAS